MTDETKKTKGFAGRPKGTGQKSTAAKPRAKPRGPDDAGSRGGPGMGALSLKLWVAARAMYESNRDETYPSIAKEFNISTTTVSRRAREERWTKCIDNLAGMSDRAHHIADTAKAAIDDAGPDLTPEKQAEVQKAVTEETGAEVRARILKRHRDEWAAPRKIAYEAIQKGGAGKIAEAFEQAKLAKITSEVLRNVQDGERKAWGMDRGGEGEKITVVIERE